MVKIEPPGAGDILRLMGSRRNGVAAMFASFNRNKRSIVVDLARPEGVDLVKSLARESDVLVQNLSSVRSSGWGSGSRRCVR